MKIFEGVPDIKLWEYNISIILMLRYCNTCTTKKPEEMFTKYGTESSDCKKVRNENSRNNITQIEFVANVVCTYLMLTRKRNMKKPRHIKTILNTEIEIQMERIFWLLQRDMINWLRFCKGSNWMRDLIIHHTNNYIRKAISWDPADDSLNNKCVELLHRTLERVFGFWLGYFAVPFFIVGIFWNYLSTVNI